jgi:two-component system sensor histidine kinase YesM
MKKRLKTIQSSLFFSYSALIMVSITVFAAFFYYYTSSLLKNKASESHKSLCESISRNLDAEITKMNTVSLNICYSNLVTNYYDKYLANLEGQEKTNSILNIEKYNKIKELIDIFVAAIGPSQTVSQINLYDFKGEMVGAGIYNQAAKVALEKKLWYEEVLKKDGEKYISPPHTDELLTTYGTNKGRFFISLCRVVFDRNWVRQGIIEIEQDCDTIFNGIRESVNGESGQKVIYIFNHEGRLLFPYNEKVTGSFKYYFKAIQNQKPGTESYIIKNPVTSNREIMTYTNSDSLGWTVIVIEPQQQVLAPVVKFTEMVVFGSIGLLLLTMLISFILARKVTTPIQKIHKAIKKMDLEMLFSQTQPKLTSDLNELEELNRAFQNMSVKLKQSMDALLLSQSQEMQSKMLALQSQMNPHFLYNTLATIIIMAEEDMKEAVITMCKNVSHMLRYISSHQSSLVKMKTEIEYTQKYLECMKFRHQKNLAYSIEIDEPMAEIKIPKLVIQPLVENAIKYGTCNEPPWRIEVKGFINDLYWQVTVKDNGPGFTPEEIANMEQKVTEFDRNNSPPSLELDGMGLLNIYLRLKLIYQEQMLFQISNQPEGGAFVTIGGRINIG